VEETVVGKHYPIAYCSNIREAGFTDDVCCVSCHDDYDEGLDQAEHWGDLPWRNDYLAICCGVVNALETRNLVAAVFTHFRFVRWLRERADESH